MISYGKVRKALAAAVETARVPGVRTVSRGAVSGPGAFPLVMVGQPETEMVGAGFCVERSEVPVAVAVARDGTNDQAVIDHLDTLIGDLVEALRDATAADPSLGGACAEAHLIRVEPGALVVQGTEHPCHTVWLEIQG